MLLQEVTAKRGKDKALLIQHRKKKNHPTKIETLTPKLP